ncbi:hypothetical protein AB0Q95_04855 [Streptomyces sp. NPDC059900]|uniref:hypothetical protein n=1 Tax=Streptomyces sp. NPDC059900 TaxID=3155816 RepID=UPI003415F9C9
METSNIIKALVESASEDPQAFGLVAAVAMAALLVVAFVATFLVATRGAKPEDRIALMKANREMWKFPPRKK